MRAGAWRKLGEFYSAPGFTDELMHLFLATDLSAADPDGRLGPDEDERLILEWRPWRYAVAAVERGEIRDAKSVAGLAGPRESSTTTDHAPASLHIAHRNDCPRHRFPTLAPWRYCCLSLRRIA